ncbi:MAG: hypothetical protein JW808_09645 [Victivallales bacterium]|nr:hypothetical protein [Victivallales bacterium]
MKRRTFTGVIIQSGLLLLVGNLPKLSCWLSLDSKRGDEKRLKYPGKVLPLGNIGPSPKKLLG